MMDRQTIDMEGARQGEISAASLQLGDHTIAIQRIATMSVESDSFSPWNLPANRASKRVATLGSLTCGLMGVASLAWFALSGYRSEALFSAIVGAGLVLISLLLAGRAAYLAAKINKTEPFYRLMIGTSDGRQTALVDNNRQVLLRLRDVVRHKLDTNDVELTGDFDLNLDIVNIKAPVDSKFTKLEPLPSMFEDMEPTKTGRRAEDTAPEILFEDEKAAAS